MAIEKNVNSYVSLIEADSYFKNRSDADAWNNADIPLKEKALVTSTNLLDDQRWISTILDDSQALSFPRNGSFMDPRTGTLISMEKVPVRILKATYELALHILENQGLLQNTGSIQDLGVSTIALKNIKPPEVIPSRIARIITPLLVNGGAMTWWRAN